MILGVVMVVVVVVVVAQIYEAVRPV